jgi:hypothetical protein
MLLQTFQVVTVVQARQDPPAVLDPKLGDRRRSDVEQEVIPRLQPQEMADEQADHPSVSEGDDGPGPDGGDPACRRADPASKGPDLLTAWKGEILFQCGPAIDGDPVRSRDLIKGHSLPSAEVDLPEVRVDLDAYAGQGESGCFTGPQERASEVSGLPEARQWRSQGLCLAASLGGQGSIGPADVSAPAALPEIAVADKDESKCHFLVSKNKNPRAFRARGCRISSSA